MCVEGGRCCEDRVLRLLTGSYLLSSVLNDGRPARTPSQFGDSQCPLNGTAFFASPCSPIRCGQAMRYLWSLTGSTPLLYIILPDDDLHPTLHNLGPLFIALQGLHPCDLCSFMVWPAIRARDNFPSEPSCPQGQYSVSIGRGLKKRVKKQVG